MSEYTRVNLRASIEATRTARDNAARAAGRSSEIGAAEVASSLSQLAAKYDALLAELLRLDAMLSRKPENVIPPAPGASPAK